MAARQENFQRFTLSQRIEHWVMTISFIILAVTGLPQRYALSFWADPVIQAFGGIESTRIIHRVAAIVFMLITVYHLIATLYRVYVRRVRLTMLPGLQDAIDLLNSIRYHLGLSRRHPKLPRFNFAEKMEYWAIIWGGVVMILTGLMLWNPIATTGFLPGEVVPAAKAAHSAEALLAVLAIIIWHFYFVHVKHFNKAIFTGKMNRHQMEVEHAAELAEIEAGLSGPPPVTPEIKRRRQQLFFPVATVIGVVGTALVIYFVTFEQTAITTIPPAEAAQAFVPATPTPVPTAFPSPTPRPSPTPQEGEAAAGGEVAAAAPVISHPLEGREQCLTCHAPGKMRPFPENHADWPETVCQNCHAPEGGTTQPSPAIPHELEGRENCTQCHQLDNLPETHQQAQFNNDNCLSCHAVATGTPVAEAEPTEEATEGAAEGTATAEPTEAAEGGEATAASIPAITHEIEGREQCLTCHALDKMKPFPENHANWPDTICQNCHAPADGERQPSPAIPHELEGRENCTQCHQLDKLPEFHQQAQFTNDSCTLCHTAGGAGAASAASTEEAAEGEEGTATAEPTEEAEGEEGTATAEPTEPAEGEEGAAFANIPPITHEIEGRENCETCHGLGKMKPFPENHANWPETICQNCHAPEGGERQPSPAIPHELEGRENCTQCHQLDKLPEFHQQAEFDNESCTLCHTTGTTAAAEDKATPKPTATLDPSEEE